MEGLAVHFVNEIFPLVAPYANESFGDSSRSEISFPTGRDYATNKKKHENYDKIDTSRRTATRHEISSVWLLSLKGCLFKFSMLCLQS